MKRISAAVFLLTLLLAACATPAQRVASAFAPVATPPASAPTETACERAFAVAAAVDAMQDTVEDMDPAVRACNTLADWIAASRKHPDALDQPGVEEVFLRNRCLVPALAGTSLCQSLP